LSQSRAVNPNYSCTMRAKGQSSDLQSLDLLYAVLLHGVIIIMIAVLAFWSQEHKSEPLKHIEVMMISAQALAKLEQQAHHKTALKRPPVRHKKVKPKQLKAKQIKATQPRKKPVVKIKSPKHKPVIKTKPVKKTAVKSKPKAVAKVDDNFDPFAPVSSSSDVKSPPRKASTTHPELANLAGKQLSRSEKEHYIALMQAAVQQHWKIAASAGNFVDPLVAMKLLPSGEIASVRILESSGNASLDASLIRAIKAAAPFTLPRQQFEFFRTNRLRFHPLK